jgi:hypothetical protein
MELPPFLFRTRAFGRPTTPPGINGLQNSTRSASLSSVETTSGIAWIYAHQSNAST